jgi:tetratricopeptide (TPR) repeat protein
MISFRSLLSGSVISSTFVLLLHGLVDDPLYGDLGSPLLLLIPGFAVLLAKEDHAIVQEDQGPDANKPGNTTGRFIAKPWIPAILIFIFLLGVFIFRQPVLAGWYANLGAVDMAKLDLTDWPQDQWDINTEVEGLEFAQQQFVKAASHDPNQRTAWHRSGLIAAQARDFDAAQEDLERAFQIDPDHRGIRKSLGYVYAWNGDLARAALLLEGIGEARDEMEVYTWWWQNNQQPELAEQASNLAQMLKLESNTP